MENVYDLKKSSSSPLVLRFCEMKENHHAMPWKGQEEKVDRKLNQKLTYIMLKIVVFFGVKQILDITDYLSSLGHRITNSRYFY